MDETASTFTDERDGQTYRTVKIGNQVWMAENLRFNVGDSSWYYQGNEDNCNKYGRLYTWDAAKKACPAGYHLPSREEWDDLVAATGGDVAGKILKSKSGWDENGNGTDDYGFSALPGGYRCSDGTLYGAGYYGYWWTVAESTSNYAYYRRMSYDGDDVYEYNNYKSNGYSVRCVAD